MSISFEWGEILPRSTERLIPFFVSRKGPSNQGWSYFEQWLLSCIHIFNFFSSVHFLILVDWFELVRVKCWAILVWGWEFYTNGLHKCIFRIVIKSLVFMRWKTNFSFWIWRWLLADLVITVYHCTFAFIQASTNDWFKFTTNASATIWIICDNYGLRPCATQIWIHRLWLHFFDLVLSSD